MVLLLLKITATIFQTVSGDQTTYWTGNKDATVVSIIVDTTTDGNYRKVTIASKNPKIPYNTASYASELYLTICNDITKRDLIFTSDEIISNEAARLWQGLVKRDSAVSVYNKDTHEYILRPVKAEQELLNYIGGPDKKKYIFVLATSIPESRGLITTFAIMEIKRKANWPLFDHLSVEDAKK